MWFRKKKKIEERQITSLKDYPEQMFRDGVIDPLTNEPVFKNEYEVKKFNENLKKLLEMAKEIKAKENNEQVN